MFLFDSIAGYDFYARSNGVIVLKDDIYIGFYDTLEEAFNDIFGD